MRTLAIDVVNRLGVCRSAGPAGGSFGSAWILLRAGVPVAMVHDVVMSHPAHVVRSLRRCHDSSQSRFCGRNSVVECQLPKLDVEGSNPFARSRRKSRWELYSEPVRVTLPRFIGESVQFAQSVSAWAKQPSWTIPMTGRPVARRVRRRSR